MPDNLAPSGAPPQGPPPPATPPAAEGQPGDQKPDSGTPPKTIPYERFAEVVAERNALREEKASWGQTPPSAPEPPASPPAYPPYAPQVGDDLAALEAELGLPHGRLMRALAPTLAAAFGPVVQTAFTTFEEARRDRDPYFGLYEQPYRTYVRQGYAPDVAMRLARGDKVNEIAAKMAEDQAKAAATPVGRFTGEPASSSVTGPGGLSAAQEQLANEWGLEPEIRAAAAAERAKRLQR